MTVHRAIRPVLAGFPVQRAADLDLPARQHLPVAQAIAIQRDHAASRHVQHGLLADPHRQRIGPGIVGQTRLERVVDVDTSARRFQPALDRDLSAADKADGLAGIDLHPRAQAHAYRVPRAATVGGQG
ncbi:hypothetical protein D3C72_1353570 [compost metagenome]